MFFPKKGVCLLTSEFKILPPVDLGSRTEFFREWASNNGYKKSPKHYPDSSVYIFFS